MIIILILAGLAGVWLGTRWILFSAAGFAEYFGWSEKFIGLAILAFGTDLPEIAVTIDAALLKKSGTDTSGLIFGNIIGSCATQIGLALGLIGIITGTRVRFLGHRRNFVYLLGSVILFGLFTWDGILNKSEGIILIITYLVFFFQLITSGAEKTESKSRVPFNQTLKLFSTLILGLLVLLFSADLLVSEVLLLSEKFNISQSVAGLILVGAGTSLPEIAVSTGAGIQKNPELAVSNIIGSNILDMLLPAGLAALISPLEIQRSWLLYDLTGLFGISLIAVVVLLNGISRREGFVLVMVWIVLLFLKSLFFYS